MSRYILGLDIGSNSVGSAWIDTHDGHVTTGISIFPAGVDESDDKRGDPKGIKRRQARRARITIRRRAERKRLLRLRLIHLGLLPAIERHPDESDDRRQRLAEGRIPLSDLSFRELLEVTDPWQLRQRGLDEPLHPFEFGRILLHLAQRRGALGLRSAAPEDEDDGASTNDDAADGKVTTSVKQVREALKASNARTFGEFLGMIRDERRNAIATPDRRRSNRRNGTRHWQDPIRNRRDSYEHCADRSMIREEFHALWEAQRTLNPQLQALLTDDFRRELDDDRGDSMWRHKGLLFGQKRNTWDLGTLGRCSLHPTDRCVPHADMYASRYLVVETLNNLRVIDRQSQEPARPLTPEERTRLSVLLSGPLGTRKPSKKERDAGRTEPVPRTTVSVTDLRRALGWKPEKPLKNAPLSLNIETDPDRTINTDWFFREIVHGAIGVDAWKAMPENLREGLNRALLRFDPDHEEDAEKLRRGVLSWGGLDEPQADALIAAWRRRPRLDAKRLNMSRRAVRNILAVMDRAEPWPDRQAKNPDYPYRWLTQIEARKLLAGDGDFRDVTSGEEFDDTTRHRYATGAKGATARDRYYMRKHVLTRNGVPIIGPDGEPLAEPPPAPMITNPVVRKSVHEVRRHLVAYMRRFGRKPDEIYIELAREAKLGRKDADQLLERNRLRNRIRRDIIEHFGLHDRTSTQQRVAVDRVVLSVQQNGVCPLCGNANEPTLTERMAALGQDCELAHILPKASGGHNGLSNLVLSHTKCNRDMARRTPREFWSAGPGFDAGMRWVEGIYAEIDRPKRSEIRSAEGRALWQCYFNRREDHAKIEQFKRDIKDIAQQMTQAQMAATTYASRQVMSYLSDVLYEGKGLPERSTGNDERRIYATDGMWTSRLRREWGLFFDPHGKRSKDLDDEIKRERMEKDRGDHRHHAVDAVVIAMSSQQVRNLWDARERLADTQGINTADDEAMGHYRRHNPLPVPRPFEDRDTLQAEVKRSIYGNGAVDAGLERPVCHRPVKRRLIGALHKESLHGPVLDEQGERTGLYTRRKSVLDLKPAHLRLPEPETDAQAIERMTRLRMETTRTTEREAKKWAKFVVGRPGFRRIEVDPSPGKSGIVRDLGLRKRLRACIEEAGGNPETFGKNDVKRLVEAGKIRQSSGIPIRSMVILWTFNDPVVLPRQAPEYGSRKSHPDVNPRSARVFDGQNNHHIEIRVDEKGRWSGTVVTGHEAASRKLTRINALRQAGIPMGKAWRDLSREDRAGFRPQIRAIEATHPLVNREDCDELGGRFVMSLCEGETIFMRRKLANGESGDPGYFVVAKLERPQSIVVVPHWDARPATPGKNDAGAVIANSQREQFAVTPSDLERLAPPGHAHAVKVVVSPLGEVDVPERD